MATILLIEDAQDLARAICRQLEAEGYRVALAADGLAGVEMHARHQPDLVILDWMLPRLDGLQVLQRIRQASPIPILMLTARSEEADRVIGLEVGADDYLTKPFSMRELLARVRALLRRIERVQAILETDRQRDAAPIRYGPLCICPEAYQVTLDGEPIELTKTEFDLLALLLRNPGRAFSRSYLLDTVWGENYVAGDRSVDNAILRLRKKLGPLGEAIETVWGVGYRLCPRGTEAP
ncbi:MAG: response regulator transcription factor [Chloroflexi bacterium]|nr:response regulator transcription factor [Chloroflexota bacterium]